MRTFNRIIAALFCAFVAFSCEKESSPAEEIIDNQEEVVDPQEEEPVTPPAETITITATIPDDLTKVTFDPSYESGKPAALALTWSEGDVIRVYNHDDRTKYSDFTLDEAYIGTKKGGFTGAAIDALSYDVEVINHSFNYASQAQPSDGDTSGLKYFASASDLADYSTIEFTNVSSVLAITAKMPSTDAAAAIKSVDITASADIFNGGNTLTLTLDSVGDAGEDGILHLFATLPQGNQAIAAGTALFVRFNAPGTGHTVYTRYIELGAQTFTAEKLNTISINASQSDRHAGLTSCDGSTSAKAYLIADAYQVAAINSLAAGGQTTYFKMIDDVDMTGVTHNAINTNSGYTQFVNFDGNNKTISNLGANLFYVFKGFIQNLTLSGSNVGNKRGIFAEYCQGTGHTITNVDIVNGSMSTTSANGGALIGRINNGSDTTVTITDCDIVNTTVSGAAQTGGLIGSADAQVVVDNCTVVKSGSGTSSVTASGSNCGGLIGQTTGTVTITDCLVSGTNVTGTGVVGGMVGFANSLVTISGSKYTGGAVTASSRYVGGFLGSTKNVASVISNCQVEDATVSTSHTDDPRCGGFVGQLQTSCQVKGCTVGTSSNKVTVSTPQPKKTSSSPDTYAVLNSGGFVGVNYGTITRNGDVRSKAYVKITSANTLGIPLNLGGFVGFGRGTIEYCDAVVNMTSLKGQYIGGFAGYVIQAGTVIDNCTVDGPVTGNNYTGGFAGYVDSGAPVISNCTVSGSVTAQSGCGGFVGQTMTGVLTNCSTSATCSFSGSNNGGFAGQIHGGTLTECSESGSVTATGDKSGTFGGFAGLIANSATLDKCYATGNVTDDKGSYNGGFVGSINKGSISITRCYASGNVTSDKTYASGFIGVINQSSDTVNATIENCYATGNIINSNQVRGGLIASATAAESLTVRNCYASGAVIGSFRLGGLIGNINTASATVRNCAAWNSEVTAGNIGSGNWSSGAVVGTAFPTCSLTDNYRKEDMPVKAFWGNVSGYTWELQSNYQHPDVSSSNPLVICEISTGTLRATTATALASKQDNYPIFPYHGKVEAGKTLSQLASTTLGWSSEIWDFSEDLPTLK